MSHADTAIERLEDAAEAHDTVDAARYLASATVHALLDVAEAIREHDRPISLDEFNRRNS